MVADFAQFLGLSASVPFGHGASTRCAMVSVSVLGGKYIAVDGKLSAQGFVILDDFVMHNRDTAGYMPMRVALARRAMGGPARVGDADRRANTRSRSFKVKDTTHRAHAFDALRTEHGETGRVVPSIFEFFQPCDEDGDDVAVTSDSGDDSTHGYDSDEQVIQRQRLRQAGLRSGAAGLQHLAELSQRTHLRRQARFRASHQEQPRVRR